MQQLKQNKEEKRAFLDSLTPDQRREAKNIEKEVKKAQKLRKQQAKPKPSTEEAEAKKKAAKAKASLKQAQAEELRLKQQYVIHEFMHGDLGVSVCLCVHPLFFV